MALVGVKCSDQSCAHGSFGTQRPGENSELFKACATRKMRQAGCWEDSGTPWVEGGSKRRLWTEQDLMDAIDYVLHEQGEPLP